MIDWKVTDIRWASKDEFKLPFWRKWPKEKTLWDKWQMPYIFSRVPKMARNITTEVSTNDYAFAIDLVSLSSLPTLIKNTKYRLVVTLNVGDENGVSMHDFRRLESIIGASIPQLPINSLSPKREIGQRKLAITIDSADEPSVAILIPHWNSWMFLKPCLEYIQKNRNPKIKEKVYVLDDESTDGSYERAKEYFKDDPLIEFFQFSRPNKKYVADLIPRLDRYIETVIDVEKMEAGAIPYDESIRDTHMEVIDYASEVIYWWQGENDRLSKDTQINNAIEQFIKVLSDKYNQSK
jgi:hypothetical protein